ncbi:16S rRNA (guanine966-N2)-methyltransferase [Bacillus mesophilus]|uniref:16S rRNA (Guanine(966)-N(2))-methyltransferase RsmD n=1 Tax=Bacillus mesophilus TaxID=1808955 RepID=A0A6M0Q1X8_9BACI|nr:16S rRNA (guanine(966)-N(2))-methyltransferase RsmD [Bacillus mesophilus]MBM7659482.1 16S rRNA (guanine966-N2)-methyltransferase [Bacillus mesophilus]NEY70355.1 16S rRNA (guanine(966)-N(2))-methyltransferase RsmD [Bacillus mesophilus]
MRVVSGKCKGHPLKAVPGQSTRPTTDKVKESIFNIIGPYFDGGLGLDLFGGSGGLGIEAISRGLDKVIFVDIDQKAIHTIKQNVESCRVKEQVEIYRNEAEKALKALIKRELTFDFIFLDPPYFKQKLEALISIIDSNRLLNQGGRIVVEHSTDVEMPDSIGDLELIRAEKYGITAVSIYKYSERMNEEGGNELV